jgi:hypothetical protein
MVGEAPLLLQMNNEGSYFMLSDLGQISAQSCGNQEVLKIAYAAGDYFRSFWTLALRGGTELITMK